LPVAIPWNIPVVVDVGCSRAGPCDVEPGRFFQITNLMHNSFILQQYVCYPTILNMFRAAPCSSSGGQIVLLQPLVSSPWKSANDHILIKWGLLYC